MTTSKLDEAAPRGGAPTASSGVAAAPRRRLVPRLRRLDQAASPYLYVAPFFLLFIGFGLFPLAYTFYVSLNDWTLGQDTHTWVGLGNYRELLADPYFWNSLRNTGTIWLVSTVPQLLAALWLAHLLHRSLRFRTFFRMGVVAPLVTSTVAVTIIFAQLYGRDAGIINWLLGLVGVGPVDWQAGRLTSNLAIASIVNWRWTGYNAILYLAALQTVPRDLYEAAAIDGASSFRQFRHITVPMLRPVIIFTVIVSTVGGLQLFAEPLLFDDQPGSLSGGAGREFQTVVLYLYEQSFGRFEFGYGSAIAWMLFLVIVLASAVNFALTRRIRSTR